MIITLAGRRTDAADAPVARFPEKHGPLVSERIGQVLKENRATVLVSAAACGADLLALDAAGTLGIRRRIVLPFPPERFRASSVVDRPGQWGPLFDQIIREVEAAGDLVILHAQNEDDATFLLTNRAIIQEAQKLAQQSLHERVEDAPIAICAVIVWEGQPRGTGDITLDFANEARARGIPVKEILTN